jgi:hypothetical protein
MNYKSDITVIINNYLDYETFLDKIQTNNLLEYYLPIKTVDFEEKERVWGCSSNIRYVEILNEDEIIDAYTLSSLTEKDYEKKDENLKIHFTFETSGNPPYLWYEYMKNQDFVKEIYYNIKQDDYCGIEEKSLEFFHSTSENNREEIERKYEIMLKIKFDNDNTDIGEILQKIKTMNQQNISRNMIIKQEKIYYTNTNRFIEVERKEKKIKMRFRTDKKYDSLFWTFDEITQIEKIILDELKKINNNCSTKIIFENKNN